MLLESTRISIVTNMKVGSSNIIDCSNCRLTWNHRVVGVVTVSAACAGVGICAGTGILCWCWC